MNGQLALMAALAAIGGRWLRDGLPPHVASAFADSGTWALLATGNSAPTVWAIGWEVEDRDAPDSRIWSLAASNGPGEGFGSPQVGVAEAQEALGAALREIRLFAKRFVELSDWASWFTKAEALLEDPAPIAPYHRDLLPLDATLNRRQLAAAVVQGWVFGGMGSWNDGGLVDPAAQREYERVGANLYSALLAGLPAAANGA